MDVLKNGILEAKKNDWYCYICNIAYHNEYIKFGTIKDFKNVFPEMYNYLEACKRYNNIVWGGDNYKSRLECVKSIKEKLINDNK